jgi:hypothetical protein
MVVFNAGLIISKELAGDNSEGNTYQGRSIDYLCEYEQASPYC